MAMSALHGFALTHRQEFLRSFEKARTDEARSLAALVQLRPRLNAEIAVRIAGLQESSRRWHSVVPRHDLPRPGQRPPRPSETAEFDEGLYADVIAKATALQGQLARESAERQRRIDAAERLDWRSTMLFTFLALVTGLFILWLGQRVQLLVQESERRRQELERLMRGRSHDIRNSLGAVVGYSELLEHGLAGKLEDRQYDMVKRMRRATSTALSILNDLLTHSQVQTGTLTIETRLLDVVPLLEEAVADYKWQADQAGLDLQVRLPEHPLMVVTDATRVRRVLGNLLSNAIKYTPAPGKVVVSADVRESAGHPRLAVEARDSGPGIPADAHDKVFEEFYRISDERRPVKGFGIGLPISRRVARLLGGDIAIESEPGKRATFTLWLPLAEIDDSSIRSAAH